MSIHHLNEVISDSKHRESLHRRLFNKVNVLSDSECWLWVAKATHHFGYGRLSAGRNRHIKAHQAAYALRYGAIPEGHSVLHKCDVPSCCNPLHLFIGTNKENTHDMMRKGRMKKPPIHRGESHHNTKLTLEDMLKIKSDSRTAKEIAAEYGISAKTVYRCKNGQTWEGLI